MKIEVPNHPEEIINVIAEFITNEFNNPVNVMDKAKRLYNIMKLEKSEEHAQIERIMKDLEKL